MTSPSDPVLPQLMLDGRPLDTPTLARIARREVEVTLCPRALDRVAQGRAAFLAAMAGGQAIYGATTGVGAMKDTEHHGAEIASFSRALPYAHQIAVGAEATPEICRLTVALRLNTLLRGEVGVSVEMVHFLAAMLRHDLIPVLNQRGSAGCADLGQMGQLATVMTGAGPVLLRGERMEAAVALRRCGMRPHPMPARDGLAAVASNSYGLAKSALEVERAAAVMRRAMAQVLPGAQAMGLNRAVWDVATDLGHPVEQRVAGWFLTATRGADWPDTGRVHDPLSGRMVVQIFGGCLISIEEAAGMVRAESAHVDDNPVVRQGRVVTNGGSLLMGLSLRLGAVQLALAHLARNIFNRCLLMTNGQIEGLPVNLVPPGVVATGYGPVMKLALEQSVRVTAASTPISVLNQTVAAGLEDEAAFISLSAGRVREQLDALDWLLTVEAMLAAQALDLRGGSPAPGVTALIHDTVRRFIPTLTTDLPQSAALMALHDVMSGRDFAQRVAQASPFAPFDETLGLMSAGTAEPKAACHEEENA